jgi:hypothetical protein
MSGTIGGGINRLSLSSSLSSKWSDMVFLLDGKDMVAKDGRGEENGEGIFG